MASVVSTLSPGLAKDYDKDKSYHKGDFILHHNAYWKCRGEIGPETWNEEHWEEIEEPMQAKADLENGKVPYEQLPEMLNDVLEYDALGNFPVDGTSGKIYVAKDTGKIYRRDDDTSEYVEISVFSPKLAEDYDSEKKYSNGAIVIYDDAYWQCNVDMSEAEEWTPGHWTEMSAPLENIEVNMSNLASGVEAANVNIGIVQTSLNGHTGNVDIHVTKAQKDSWDAKQEVLLERGTGKESLIASIPSAAEEYRPTAGGQRGVSLGYATKASGDLSVALNNRAEANGARSLAAGYLTTTQNNEEVAFGKANKSNENTTLFSIGIGTASNNAVRERKNALEVDISGKVYALGVGGFDGTNPSNDNDVKSAIDSKRDKTDFAVGDGWVLTLPSGEQVWLAKSSDAVYDWYGFDSLGTRFEVLYDEGYVVNINDDWIEGPDDINSQNFAIEYHGDTYRLVRGSRLALDTEIPPAQVNADWNATGGAAQILNKPTIPTVPTPVAPSTDASAAGKPADAKATGDALAGKLSNSGGTMTGDIVFDSGQTRIALEGGGLTIRDWQGNGWELFDDDGTPHQVARMSDLSGKANVADLNYRILTRAINTQGFYQLANRTINKITSVAQNIQVIIPSPLTGYSRDFYLEVQNTGGVSQVISFSGYDLTWTAYTPNYTGIDAVRSIAAGTKTRIHFSETSFTDSNNLIMFRVTREDAVNGSGPTPPTPTGNYTFNSDGTVSTDGTLNADGTLSVEGTLNNDGTFTVDAT